MVRELELWKCINSLRYTLFGNGKLQFSFLPEEGVAGVLDRGFVPKSPLSFSTSYRVATDRVSQVETKLFSRSG